MPIPKYKLIFKGAVVGALTSLPVMILSYVGQMLASYTFLPFDLFKWITSFFPARLVTSAIVFGRIIPKDAVIKEVEYAISIIIFIIVGALFGTILGVLTGLSKRYVQTWGWIGGVLLLVFFLSIEINFGLNLTSREILFLGTSFLCLGWGWVMGQWAHLESNWASNTPATVNLSRRRFLIYISASGLAAIISFLGILQYEQKHQSRVPSPLAKPKLPR